MYTIALTRDLIARHRLIDRIGDAESEFHAHQYTIEIQLQTNELDPNGYVVDLDDFAEILEKTADYFEGATLNDLPDFRDINPSVEHFTRLFCDLFLKKLKAHGLNKIITTIWETDDAWGAYEKVLK